MNALKNRFLAIAVIVLLPICRLNAEVVSVNNTTAGRVYYALQDMGVDVRSIDSLIVTGTVDETDFKVFNNLMLQLAWLDLSGTDITVIPREAFADCSHLEEITVPSSLTEFDCYSFQNCYNLKTVNGVENVEYVKESAFNNCYSLNTLTFGDNIISIGSSAFWNSGIGGDLVFPASLKQLGGDSFGCTKILSVDLSKTSISSIPWGCFRDCFQLGSYVLPEDHQLIIEGWSFRNDTLLRNVFIPSNVTMIYDEAFYIENDNKDRTFIIESKTPVSIDSRAFGSYNGHYTLYVPSGSSFDYLITRGYSAFGNILELGYEFILEGKGSVTVDGKDYPNGSVCFPDFDVDATQIIFTPVPGYEIARVLVNGNQVQLTDNTYAIGKEITTATVSVLFVPKSLTLTVSISSGGTLLLNNNAISDGAVLNVDGGDALTFTITPDKDCFVKGVAFNNSQVGIVDGALSYETPVLTDNSTLEIDFGSKDELVNYVNVNVVQKGAGKIQYNGIILASGSNLLIRKGEPQVYTFIPATSGYIKSLLVNSFDMVSYITDNTFTLSGITQDVNMVVEFFSPVDVVIDNPNGRLKDILNSSDIVARKIKYLKLTGNVTDKDFAIISSMAMLEKVDLSGTTIIEIPERIFKDKSNLKSVALPLTLTRINNETFANCKSLVDITGFDNVSYLAYAAFHDCSELTVFPFGNRIETIEHQVFEGCNKLPKDIVMYPSLKYLGGFVFNYEGINSIDLRQCVFENTDFCWYAFNAFNIVLLPEKGNYSLNYDSFNGSKIKSLIIPASVNACRDRIFAGCQNLRTIYMQSSVPPLAENDPFGIDCSSITLYVPAGSLDEYSTTMYWGSFGRILEYGIGVQTDGNGSVFVNGSRISGGNAIFPDGNVMQVKVEPKSGYELDIVSLDGTALVAQQNGTFLIPGDVNSGTLSIKCKPKRFGITVNTSGNGRVYVGGRELANGEVLTADTATVVQFELEPESGYMVKTISFNGQESVVQNGGRTFVTPALYGSSVLDIAFAVSSGSGGVNEFIISTGDNGSIVYRNTTLLKQTSVNIATGERAVFQITPNSYYKIGSVTYNGTDVTDDVVNGSLVIDNVLASGTINVDFVLDNHVSVSLMSAGTLESNMFYELRQAVEYLTVSGPMNDDDFRTIREELPNLMVLDMSNAEFDYLPSGALETVSDSKLVQVMLPRSMNSIGNNAFKGLRLETLYVNSEVLHSFPADAFDQISYYTTIVYVPQNVEVDYRLYTEWRQFKNVTDGIIDHYGDKFTVDNVQYEVTDFENSKVKAVIDYISQFESLPGTISVDGLTFTIESVRLVGMDDSGFRMIIYDGSMGPWQGKYLYSSTNLGETWAGAPADDWMNPDFDDSSWTTFDGPIKSPGYGGYTDWQGEFDCYWVRRYFNLTNLDLASVAVNVTMDDEIMLYINGVFVYSGGSGIIDIPSSCLRIGQNVIAARGINSGGGPGYMDFSLGERGYVINNLKYVVTNEFTKECILTGATAGQTEIVIPATISILGTEYKVTQIANSAFMNDSTLISVSGLENIIRIEPYAFRGCKMLSSINLPDQLYYIGEYAFENCVNLNQDIIIPATVIRIGQYAFSGSGITNLTLHCNYLDEHVFYGCKSLEGIFLGAELENIPNWTFEGCTSLRNAEIHCRYLDEGSFLGCESLVNVIIGTEIENLPNNVFSSMQELQSAVVYCKFIGSGSFRNCQSLESLTLGEGVETINDYAFYGTGISSLSVSCSYIGNGAFRECGSLESITLGEGVVTLSGDVFNGCSNISGQLTIPSTLKYIGSGAFYNCSKINQDLIIPSTVETINSSAFCGTGISSLTVSCNYIGESAFRDCKSLETITLGEGVETISNNVFSDCSNITGELVLPSTLKYIGNEAFFGCSKINQNLIIPASVERIDNRAFYGTGISGVSISSKFIGGEAFRECKSLESIIFAEGVEIISNSAFFDCSGISGVLILPESLIEIGECAFSGCKGITTVNIPQGVTNLSNYAFDQCLSLTSVRLNEGLKIIGFAAFCNTQLVEVALPSTVREIGNHAFSNNVKLNSVSFKEGVTTIKDAAFENCTSLEEVVLPNTITRIEERAFGYCYNLISVKLPESLTYLGREAFVSCRQLKEIVIPQSVTTIDNYAFNDCSNLQKVNLNDGLLTIGWAAFHNTAVDSIVIPSTVQVLKSDVLSDCHNLAYVNLPSGLTAIGSRAFANDDKLNDVIIPETVTTIESDAFNGCRSLTALTIPASVTSIGENALLGIGMVTMASTTPPAIVSTNQFDVYAAIVLPDEAYNTYCNATYWKELKAQFTTMSNFNVVANVTQDSLSSNLNQVLGEENLPYIIGLKVIGTINSYDIMIMRNKMTLLRYLDLSEATIVANDYEYYEGCHTEDYIIGDNSFRGLNLSSFIMPENTKRIGNYAFNGCGYLTKIVIPDAVEYIGFDAFGGCGVLQSVYIGDGVKSIESNAFNGCWSMRELRLGKNVEAIGDCAFAGCGSLTHIEFTPKIKYLSSSAFQGCGGLTDIVLPPNLVEISYYAFEGCGNLRELKIPSSVKYIRDGAFWNCPLEKVYTYTIEPTNINQNTFSAYKTASLYVPATSYYNYYWHTQWSQFLELVEFDEPYDFFYLNGDYDLDDNTGRIAGVPDMEMNQTSGITVEGNDVQEISAIDLNYDYSNEDGNENNDAGPSIIAGSGDTDNGVANLTAQSMDVNIGVDGNRWYFFCFPFDLNLDSIDCSAEYVFYKYDGLKRSRGLSGWTKLEADDMVLTKGNGYIFQASYTSMLTIHVANEYLNFTGEIENQALNTYESNDLSNSSWNFVGNPFISYYDIKDLSKEYDAPIAVWNGWTYDVYKPGDDDYQLKPFEAFFVQKSNNKSSIEYLPENRITYSTSKTRMAMYASQRAAMGTPMAIDRQLVNIVIMNSDSVSDRTRIVYSTKATKDYEIGVDAAKFHTDGVPQIYTLAADVKYAINERPMSDDDIRIGFCAPTDGTYTLSIPRQDADVAIFDKETGKYVDFTFGDYSFVTKAGTFNDRFVIHRTGGVTAVENGFMLNGLTVVAVDSGIDIEGHMAGKIAVYTESGMLVAEPTQTGRLLLSDGVYIVKIGERSVKISVN